LIFYLNFHVRCGLRFPFYGQRFLAIHFGHPLRGNCIFMPLLAFSDTGHNPFSGPLDTREDFNTGTHANWKKCAAGALFKLWPKYLANFFIASGEVWSSSQLFSDPYNLFMLSMCSNLQVIGWCLKTRLLHPRVES